LAERAQFSKLLKNIKQKKSEKKYQASREGVAEGIVFKRF
jgi:hypothetical protein